MRTLVVAFAVLSLAALSAAREEEEEDPSRPGFNDDDGDDVWTNGPLAERRHRHERSRQLKMHGNKHMVNPVFCFLYYS
jgi:hypothetical protein